MCNEIVTWRLPSFDEAFATFYHSTTYLPAIDLNSPPSAEDLLATENPEVAEQLRAKIEQSEILALINHPPSPSAPHPNTWDTDLATHGFDNEETNSFSTTFCNDHYSYIYYLSHDLLPNKTIHIIPLAEKALFSACVHKPLPFLRQLQLEITTCSPGHTHPIAYLAMNKRIKEVAEAVGIVVALPKLQLLDFNNTPVGKRQYCLISEAPPNLLSSEETIDAIHNMCEEHQRELAKKISMLIKGVGIAHASFDTIRLTSDNQLALVDVDPVGIPASPGATCPSLEKCARTGLLMLQECARENNLEIFREQIQQEYRTIATPKLSTRAIVLSVLSFGLLPLIYVIITLFATIAMRGKNNAHKQALTELEHEVKIYVDKQYPGEWNGQHTPPKMIKEAQDKAPGVIAIEKRMRALEKALLPYIDYQDLSLNKWQS